MNIAPKVARHVMYYYGFDGGYPPGGFTNLLMQLIKHADSYNIYLLRRVYPEYVYALLEATEEELREAASHDQS